MATMLLSRAVVQSEFRAASDLIDRVGGGAGPGGGGAGADGTFVKAVTYHRLRVEPDPGGGWLAEVYLDV